MGEELLVVDELGASTSKMLIMPQVVALADLEIVEVVGRA